MLNRKIKPVRQSELAECGYACLAMILDAHHVETDLNALRNRFEPSSRGTTLKTLMGAADAVGLIPRAVKLPIEELPDLLLPAILHWDMSHYVVLEKVANGRFLVHDPANGSAWMEAHSVSRHFTGVALELRPSNAFAAPPPTPVLKIRQLWGRLHGAGKAFSQIILLSIFVELLALTTPYFLQVGVDTILPSEDIGLLNLLGLVFLLVALMQGAVVLLRSVTLTRIGTQIGFGLAINIARHLLRLPISWHKRRMLGDIVGRLNAINPIQDSLTRGATLAIVDGLFGAATFFVMLIYSPSLASISLIAVLLNFGVRMWLSQKQNTAEQAAIVALGNEQSTIIECLRGITSIRMLGQEQERHAVWQNQRSEVSNAQAGAAVLRAQGEAAANVIGGIETTLSVWLGLMFVIQGALTIGMFFAFSAFRAMFWVKARALVEQAAQLRLLRLYLNRVADVVLSEEDESFVEQSHSHRERIGRIELRNVSYRYSASEPYAIKDVSLTIEAGDHIAITGKSGCGKSTLIMIILGLIRPTHGALFVDGIEIREFGYRNYHQQLSAVLQDDTLFTGTLSDNISMFVAEPSEARIRHVAELAGIAPDIEAMPLKYRTLISDMGSTLSSGQRQRILIARTLYREPSFIVMDEATSHLDTDCEKLIARNLDNLGVTRVTVAHREETLRHASARYTLVNGLLVRDA